jgi:hypothetical protein
MEDKQQQCVRRYRFRRDQVGTGDVRKFLEEYDPHRLPNSRVAELFGGVAFDFDVSDPVEVPQHPALRILLRRLHAIWPWSGFFLALDQPLGPAVGINKVPLLALGLCISDFEIFVRPAKRESRLTISGPQLRKFRDIAHDTVDRLGRRAGLPTIVIQARHDAVAAQLNLVLK